MLHTGRRGKDAANDRQINILRLRSEVSLTPDVGHAVRGVLPAVGPAEGELGLAFLRRGRVLRQELHDVRVLLVASDAAFADDVHDAGEHVAGAAAETPGAGRAGGFPFLTRVQYLEGTNEMFRQWS